MSKFLYYLHMFIFYPLHLVFFKTKIFYEDDTKHGKYKKGKAIILSNHRSFWDGLVIAYKFLPTKFHFVSDETFFRKYKIVMDIVRTAGGIFLYDNFDDFQFIEDSRKVTEKDRPILYFPEGGFRHTYEPAKFYTGYVLLSIKTQTKIVPIVNDFNYGLFKRVHLLIGNSIDLSEFSNTELTRLKRKEINNEIYNKYLLLFYELKRKKAEKFRFKYKSCSPNPGDVIRVPAGYNPSCYHYGIYFNDNEVIQFGRAQNKPEEEAVVNSVSLKEFCSTNNGEAAALQVRIAKKLHTRKFSDIEKYAKSCLGQGRYSFEKNNCHDFANRVTLKI